ncbi:putative type IX secretion system sortase PorU2 [Spirosoma aerolatum]|uniref:putative type IX secretion system sortase PorU2 n=1 Tax=Spirosoma aerolatum TaxID=1211326 RepID=UPI0009AD4036|nr:C25 family cysteine peptidase [Spirosoma aerolatum]
MFRLFVYLIFIFLVGSSFPIKAQAIDPNPTQWISYDQTYYKIPVAEPGIYRITAAELARTGIPVHQLDPTTLQLFHRGIEQAIFIEGEADHRFDPTDFLEFYGQPNDGTQDSLLYRPHSAQPHRYYSLFNDTTAYFLTWRLDGKPGKRMAIQTDTNANGLIPETYHWSEELRLFTSDYPGWAAGLLGKTEYSYYEAGEGYTGQRQQKNQPSFAPFQLTDPARYGPDPQVDVLVVGREVSNHRVSCLIGSTAEHLRLQDSVRFVGYANAHMQFPVNWSAIDTDGHLMVSTVSGNETTTSDTYSVSYIRLRYPQRLTANRQSFKRFELQPNFTGRALLTISDVLPNTAFWDITSPDTPSRLRVLSDSATSARLVVSGTTSPRTLLSTTDRKLIAGLHRITFTDWSGRTPSYVIISHESLMKPATSTAGDTTSNAVKAYAAYRASTAGGGFDTLTVTMQQLIDQYSYGERHPLAIRRFIRPFLQANAVSPYLLLIGRGRSTPGIRKDPQQAMLDMVMTAGYPGSDTWFSAEPIPDQPNIPTTPTGRINASTPLDVMNYLAKVKEFEKPSSNQLWRKHLLHLSGGLSPNELSLFRQLVDTYRTQAVGPALGALVTTVSKVSDQPVEVPGIAKTVNNGVGLITFFGHSGLDVTDLDIGFCSNEALGYRNKGNYPLLLVNGCAIGNIFYGRPTLSTDWVLTADRGAIAALAHSHLGTVDALHQYTSTFYNLLADSVQLNKSIGLLQLETIRRVLTQTTDGQALATCQQMVLQGDPAIRLFPFSTPDYVLNDNSLTIEAPTGQPLTLLSDSIQIRVAVDNIGLFRPGLLPFRVRRWINGQETGVFNLTLVHTIAYRDTLTLTLPTDRTAEGANRFEVTINPIGQPATQPESDHTNNQAQIEINLISPKPVLIYPPSSTTLTNPSVQLTAQYISDGPHRFELDLDSTARFDSPFRTTQLLTAHQFISYSTVLPNQPNVTYFWRVRLADNLALPFDTTAWSVGSFVYAPFTAATGLPEGQLQAIAQLPTDSQQGDIVSIPVQLTNLSPYPFSDSLVVQQTVYATALSTPQLTQWRIEPPAQADTVRFSIRIPTERLPGRNRVRLTVNPHLQPEYSYLNNTLDFPLLVDPDVLGPLLEVAFDGARIADGAVVSSHPVLDILVADDNRSLMRQDTLGLDIYLQKTGKNAPFVRLNWHNVIRQSMEKGNIFRLQYPLPTLTDGLYHLIATARDAVGNAAVPYQVSFRVVSETLLDQLSVSPNPFQHQVVFSFSLTGEQAPSTMTLTIIDLNGHLVRSLFPVARIGRNQLVWDGRDETGTLRPAGMYLYQLTVLDAQGEFWPVADPDRERLRGRIVFIR